MRPAFAGVAEAGYSRAGVYFDHFERLKQKVERITGGISTDATLRRLTLSSSRDSTTGWRTKTWTERDIEGFLIPRAAATVQVAAGIYVRTDFAFLTMDGVLVGDEIQVASKYYRVEGVLDFLVGDSFMFRQCDVTHLPLHT
jgi:hypothetical protein